MKRFLTGISVLSLVALAAACGEDDGGKKPSSSSSTTGSGGAGATGGMGSVGHGGHGGAGATGGMGGAGATGGMGGAGGTGGAGGGMNLPKPPVSPYIVVDQFGYPPGAPKIAVVRNPEIGFDGGESFTPGGTYALVDAQTGAQVATGSATPWSGGATDASSGDKAYWFDFSSVTEAGDYYVLDVEKDVRSHEFRIAGDVYRDVLKHAVRTFFYQRAGFEKKAEHAGAGWADGPSHVGPGQDKNARLYSAKNDASTERDLSGGWYDAGDYNKYTNWHARYVVTLLKAYLENPAAFTDDYGIPESGNGVPDVIDEVKWGMDWLVRMQKADGSVISIVGMAHASPPSASQGPSYYGNASTSATLSTSAAFALGAKVFRSLGQTAYADNLVSRAKNAYTWANANPNVIFHNNDAASGTSGLGAGDQETNDYGRLHKKLEAAVYLFEETKDNAYRTFVDANYNQIHLMQWTYAYPFEADEQGTLLYYTKVPNATSNVVTAIKNTFKSAMDGSDNWGAIKGETDPYRAFLKDYVWGSNGTKSQQGNMFQDIIAYNIDAAQNAASEAAALRYVNYIHGVNPLGMVYLSNMYGAGAEKGVNEFYHAWFANGSAAWDRVGESTYGPAPGFLVGGPNPSYDWDGCCPSNCGSAQNNAVCNSENLSPPKGQPQQKSYKDFNTSWPLNSWSVTENSNGYQVAYIRLLSKFVK